MQCAAHVAAPLVRKARRCEEVGSVRVRVRYGRLRCGAVGKNLCRKESCKESVRSRYLWRIGTGLLRFGSTGRAWDPGIVFVEEEGLLHGKRKQEPPPRSSSSTQSAAHTTQYLHPTRPSQLSVPSAARGGTDNARCCWK